MAGDAPELPLSLDPLIAEAKQRMRRRRLLAAAGFALVVAATAGVIASGEAGAVGGLFHSNGFEAAKPCSGPNALGVWAYETPPAPGRPPSEFGVMLVKHPIKVGDHVGRLKVTAIAALPYDCTPVAVLGASINQPGMGILNGRLILQPIR
jgi:hypothetical protein